MQKILSLLYITIGTSAFVFAQNTAVLWGTFDQGFARTASSGTMVTSIAGQTFAGSNQSPGFWHDAGFLADTLLRGIPQQVPVYSFQKTFGYGGGWDQGFSVIQTRDSGYVLGGWTTSFGGGRMYIVKTDHRGVQSWSKAYETPSYDQCLGLDQTTDGGLILAGFRTIPYETTTDLFYVRTNGSGDTIWTRKLGESSNSQGTSVRQTPDGGFIIGGFKKRPVYGDYDYYLVKVKGNGDTSWTRTFDVAADNGTSVEPTSDGGYILTGYTQAPYITQIVLIKTDSLGTLTWIKGIGPNNNQARAYAVRQTIDGGYIIAGSYGQDLTAYSAYLYKADNAGNLVWQRWFRNTDSWTGYDIRQVRDGGYILTGAAHNPTLLISDAFLLKTDINGDSLWTTFYGGSGDDVGHSVRQTYDGGYVIGGFTNSYGVGLYDMYLVKGDPHGTVTAIGGFPSSPIPEQFQLYQNYPNPFNPSTTITYDLPTTSRVGLKLYTILGQEVRTMVDEVQSPGHHSVHLDARNLASGVYFYRLQAGEYVASNKMLVLK